MAYKRPMAILSESELESVLSRMIRRLQQILYNTGDNHKLELAIRGLQATLDAFLKGHNITLEPEETQALVKATEAIRAANLGDQKLEDDSYDVEDYLSYRM